METYFFDSSGLLKRYVNESGTVWVNNLTAPKAKNTLYVARITGAEIVSALTRRYKGGSLTANEFQTAVSDFRHDFQSDYRNVEISETLISQAMDLAEKHALRGYDAVQLAAALEVHNERVAFGLPAPTLISSDLALNEAATAQGLTVDDPNLY